MGNICGSNGKGSHRFVFLNTMKKNRKGKSVISSHNDASLMQININNTLIITSSFGV